MEVFLMKRIGALLVTLFVMAFAGVASAHVTVWPKQSKANAYERYTIRVPTEKDIPTVKLRVELPAGATFSSVLPVPGWKFETEKDAFGKVVALVWSGGEIKKGEFMEFGISVKNAKDPGDTVWKAYQTYSDGSVVEWTGAPDSKTPAPMVKLEAGTADDHGHDQKDQPAAQQPAKETPAATQPAAAQPAQGGSLGTWLGGAGLAVSLVALFLALRKR
jgi:uncharacterized protein YcnI